MDFDQREKGSLHGVLVIGLGGQLGQGGRKTSVMFKVCGVMANVHQVPVLCIMPTVWVKAVALKATYWMRGAIIFNVALIGESSPTEGGS